MAAIGLDGDGAGDDGGGSTPPCRYCGAVPTKVCAFAGYYSSWYLAFGMKWGRPPTWGARGPMCRSCALAVGRHLQTATLNVGWWGLWDLLFAPGIVCWNTFALRRANAMPSGEATAHTLHPGFPVHQRPLWGLVGLIAIVAIATVLIAVLVWLADQRPLR